MGKGIRKKYTRTNTAELKRLVAENGYDVKVLAILSGQCEEQVRRNLKKLDRGEEIGIRGYGKCLSLDSEEFFTFMWKKFEKKTKKEIMSCIGLSDSKFRRMEKIITVPYFVVKSGDFVGVHLSCDYTQFFIVWYLGGEEVKVGFSQQFKGEKVEDESLCVEVMKIISQNFFDVIEERKIERIKNEEEKFEYYLNYFNRFTPQFERMDELRKYLPDALPADVFSSESECEDINLDRELEDNNGFSIEDDFIRRYSDSFNTSSSLPDIDEQLLDCIDDNLQSK